MKELTIRDIETIVHRDECRVMEAKKTTGEIKEGLRPHALHLRRQAVLESGEHHDADATGDV